MSVLNNFIFFSGKYQVKLKSTNAELHLKSKAKTAPISPAKTEAAPFLPQTSEKPYNSM